MTAQTPAPGMTTLPGAGTNPDWKLYGACREVDPDLWFPKPNVSTAAARAVCLQCEVRLICLEYALEHGERGIWGATDEGQRKAIRKARDKRPDRPQRPRTGGKTLAACGTRSAYDRHVRHGEHIDDACQAAHDAYLVTKAEKKRERYAETRRNAA